MLSRKTATQWLRRLRQRVPFGPYALPLTPVSQSWGLERGTPVDRYYIERFLDANRPDIRGRVLEVKDSGYTNRFGSGVVQPDVLDIDPTNTRATFVADLAAADAIPDNTFDCFVLTQTLQLIFDLPAAIFHAHRILRPGGVLLCTVPTISRLVPRYGLEHDHWRFTPASSRELFGNRFGAGAITVQGHGNVAAALAFLLGMAREELLPRQLETEDPYHPILVTVRAVK
jgi:SAM-dependent methyltransferase